MEFKKVVMVCLALALLTSFVLALYTYYKVRKTCSRSTHILYNARRAEGAKIFTGVYKAQEIALYTQDGIALSLYQLIRPHARRVILFCHGFWQAKEFLYKFAALFPDDTLLFLDFRTHGSSKGRWISYGYYESQDVRAAVDYIKHTKQMAELPLYAIGLSMGSASILKAAYEGAPLDGIVIDSGFACLTTQMGRLFTRMTGLKQCFFGPTKQLFEYTLGGAIADVSPAKFIQALSIPVLIIHSTTDKTVPVEDAYALYSCARGKKELWTVSGPGHVQIYKYYPQEYKQKFDNFFNNN
ncbi:alpha/beta fold hydrolase [Candidatus Dependentiae bacterium]|nr:alpha/beta fold hydrolase [Candidatus Dependentiae bacterium]